ncbi:MAG: hypothetical protein ACI9VR_003304, partial [Cognaticolwellia sp.]
MFLALLTLTAQSAAAQSGADSAGAQRDAVTAQAPTRSSELAMDGALAPYLRVALEQSPQLKAAYAAWDM